MIQSLYIHIPFCQTKCRYCSFNSQPGLEYLHKDYMKALIRELEGIAADIAHRVELDTLFLGGGTPSVFGPDNLQFLLQHITDLFRMGDRPEISIEVNPGTVDTDSLKALRQTGFNRISIGVQSFHQQELARLGRCHTPEQAVQCVVDARKAGFDNLSLDLMYGLPGQDLNAWQANLSRALDLAPDHLSMYQLTVEEGTPFFDDLVSGKIELPDDECIIAMDELNLAQCEMYGLKMYEISNFAKSGYRCRHNVNYWLNGDYLAAGAGAVSHIDGVRLRRCEGVVDYIGRIDSGGTLIVEQETMSREEKFRETVIMGLRMTDGVDGDRLLNRFAMEPVSYYGTVLEKLERGGFVEVDGNHLKLTPRGRRVSNSVLAELV